MHVCCLINARALCKIMHVKILASWKKLFFSIYFHNNDDNHKSNKIFFCDKSPSLSQFLNDFVKESSDDELKAAILFSFGNPAAVFLPRER